MSYRFMNMGMNKLKEEDNNISNTDALNNYMVVPENMSMNMHMLGAMYAPSNKITLMAMANYIENDMNLQINKNKRTQTHKNTHTQTQTQTHTHTSTHTHYYCQMNLTIL